VLTVGSAHCGAAGPHQRRMVATIAARRAGPSARTDTFPPAWPEPSPGTTVSIGLYLPGRRANAGHCLRTSTTRSPGRYTPFPADPQVSSVPRLLGKPALWCSYSSRLSVGRLQRRRANSGNETGSAAHEEPSRGRKTAGKGRPAAYARPQCPAAARGQDDPSIIGIKRSTGLRCQTCA